MSNLQINELEITTSDVTEELNIEGASGCSRPVRRVRPIRCGTVGGGDVDGGDVDGGDVGGGKLGGGKLGGGKLGGGKLGGGKLGGGGCFPMPNLCGVSERT